MERAVSVPENRIFNPKDCQLALISSLGAVTPLISSLLVAIKPMFAAEMEQVAELGTK